MPIRYRDQQTRLGSVAATLDGMSGALTGTFTSAATRTGVIVSQLQAFTGSFSGNYSTAPNRTGVIGTTLSGMTGVLQGTFALPSPRWDNQIATQELVVGQPYSLDLDTVCDPDTCTYSIIAISGPDQPGIALNGSVFSGTPTVAGVTTVTFRANDNVPTGAEADWIARSTGPGVVWAHDFRSDSEVDNFRWTGGYGNDPTAVGAPTAGWCRRITTDYISGTGCLEIYRAAGSVEPSGWHRPFAALNATGNGLTANDLAASGTVTRRTWTPSTLGMLQNFQYGGYAHADYAGVSHDGTDFYVQYRTKISASRWTGGNEGFDGKLSLFQVGAESPYFDLVTQAKGNRIFDIYTAFGSPGPLEFLEDPQSFTTPPFPKTQPGGLWDNTCRYPYTNPGDCWRWPADTWVTVLLHITPGHVTNGAWGTADWGIDIKAALPGQAYQQVISKANYQFYFQTPTGNPAFRGWNVIHFNGYHNHQNMPGPFTQRVTQVIFSKQPIAVPAV